MTGSGASVGRDDGDDSADAVPGGVECDNMPTPTGKLVWSIVGAGGNHLVTDGDAAIWASDGELTKYSATGRRLWRVERPEDGAWYGPLAIDPTGSARVALIDDGARLHWLEQFDPSGLSTASVTVAARPVSVGIAAVAVDAWGHSVVVTYGSSPQVMRLSHLGDVLWVRSLPGADGLAPTWLALQPTGAIDIVAVANEFGASRLRVTEFDASGDANWQHDFGYDQLDFPSAVDVDLQGNVVVATPNRLRWFSAHGEELRSIARADNLWMGDTLDMDIGPCGGLALAGFYGFETVEPKTWLAKLSPDGALLWSHVLEPSALDPAAKGPTWATTVTIAPQTAVIVAGRIGEGPSWLASFSP